ncbi:MAG: CPBP family intramembrane glutamic endopeptidase [Candidatus Sericytochromatia bacterium]
MTKTVITSGIGPPVWRQLLLVGLSLLIGVLVWGSLLWWVGGRPRPDMISTWLQGLYVVGLYVLLLGGCLFFYRHFKLPLLPKPRLGGVLLGLCCAYFALGLFFGLAHILELVSWHPPTAPALKLACQALLLGLSIAFIEENLFRGLIQDTLHQRYRWEVATGIQGLLFAAVHLLRWPVSPELLLQGPGLWLTALLLTRAREQSGSLSLSIGLHAGWVSLCSWSLWTQSMSWAPEALFWTGGGNPVGGVSGWILLLLLERGIACSHVLTPFANICNNETTD